jgi:hypothetical protein
MNSSSAPRDIIGDIAVSKAAENAFISEGGRLGQGTEGGEDNIDTASLEMAELAISHVDRFYRFRGYRYERLEDAVAYARLMRSRGVAESPQERASVADAVGRGEQPPDAAIRETMAALGISYVGGLYCFEDFRYERRADAMHYALEHRRLRAAGVKAREP